MFMKQAGRFFRGLVRVLTFGLVKLTEPMEDSPAMVGLQYEEIIEQKAKAAQQLKNSIGALMGQQETLQAKYETLQNEIKDLEDEKAGFLALARDRIKHLTETEGKTQEQALADAEVMQYQASFSDADSSLTAKMKHLEDIKQQVGGMQESIDNYIIQGQQMAREVETLRQEKHEAVANIAINRNIDKINEALAGISTSGADDQLANIRRRTSEIKGRAKASQRIASTDVSVQRQKAKEAAKRVVANKEFLAGLGIKKEAAPETAARSDTGEKSQLPES